MYWKYRVTAERGEIMDLPLNNVLNLTKEEIENSIISIPGSGCSALQE